MQRVFRHPPGDQPPVPPVPAREIECLDCGHNFDPDTSPDEDRCWMCAERADAEASAQ